MDNVTIVLLPCSTQPQQQLLGAHARNRAMGLRTYLADRVPTIHPFRDAAYTLTVLKRSYW